MPTKSVSFSRVSTREQAEEGYSLSSQEKLLKEYATKSRLALAKKFSVPESASGKQERTLFNELLSYLKANPNIKVVICEKVDRITRNLKDAVNLDDWLNEDEQRQIHFVKQNLIVHKNAKSNEKFMWDIYLAMARQYSNNLSEEAKKGLNEKAAQGWYPGAHKRGYKSIGEMGRKIWVLDEESAEPSFIIKAFELYNSGNFTLRTLSQYLFNEGWVASNGKAIKTGEVHRVLTDPFFCGQFIWKGKLYEGKHTPLISKELFYSVQERLERKLKAGKYRKHNFLFGGGLMICTKCGRAVTWEVQKGHGYGHCTRYGSDCTEKKYVREEKVEGQVLEILDKFKITDPYLLEWVRKALKESHTDESQYHSNVMEDLTERQKKLERRLDTIYEDRLDEKITKGFYERKRIQYEAELESIGEAINKHTKANIDYMKLGINIFELAQKGREIYEKKIYMHEKKEFLNFIFSNLKLEGENVYPEFKNGFEVIALRAQDGNWQGWSESNTR